jgi:hypothetical protein
VGRRSNNSRLGVAPVASVAVSAQPPPPDPASGEAGAADDHAAAAAALRAAFTRLQPQGSDAWNFLAAFTHLGDRYGPYQPGASDLSRQMEASERGPDGGAGSWRRRLLQKAGLAGTGAGTVDPAGQPGATGKSELEQAMAQVVEAFRFLSARVRTLEERLAHEDRPIEGAAWLAPARELGQWVDPVVAHIVASSAGGEVLHGDCGGGALLAALGRAGVAARGVEPRGAIALAALEDGHTVALTEVADELAVLPEASLGGLVLNGVVDRLPLHALVSLVAGARRALALGAPIVVVASDPEQDESWAGAVATDLLAPRILHAATWELLLARAGFVSVASLGGGLSGDTRFGISAATPT